MQIYNHIVKEITALEFDRDELIKHNTKLVKSISDKMSRERELTDSINELEATQQSYIAERKQEIRKEHHKILSKIAKWEDTKQHKENELRAREERIDKIEEELSRDKRHTMENELSVDSKLKEITEANNRVQEIANNILDKQRKVEGLYNKIKKEDEWTKKAYKEAKDKRDRMDNLYNVYAKRLEQREETLNKQKQLSKIERVRIDKEWIKIKDQWSQLLNAKKSLWN